MCIVPIHLPTLAWAKNGFHIPHFHITFPHVFCAPVFLHVERCLDLRAGILHPRVLLVVPAVYHLCACIYHRSARFRLIRGICFSAIARTTNIRRPASLVVAFAISSIPAPLFCFFRRIQRVACFVPSMRTLDLFAFALLCPKRAASLVVAVSTVCNFISFLASLLLAKLFRLLLDDSL